MKHIQINSLSDQHIHFHTVIQIVWISYPDADCRYSMHARQFLALCEILEIYDIYTEFVGQSPLNPFRNLNENGMNKVLEYISDLESTGNYKPAEIIPIHVIRERKVYYNTVSAGTGSFLDSDEYEIFSSPGIPEAATFGVYVDGDSMEPKYHNKDLIWIEQTACLDDGEIGIFYLDGNAYVKKFQNNRLGTYLISLNKNMIRFRLQRTVPSKYSAVFFHKSFFWNT